MRVTVGKWTTIGTGEKKKGIESGWSGGMERRRRREKKEKDADENGANDSLMKAEAEGRLEFRQRPGFFYIVSSPGV